MKKQFWAIPILLAGCASIRPLGNATLVVHPEVGYCSQTTVTPYTASDINHLSIRLFSTLDQDLGISRDLPNADLGRSIAFANLKNSTTYRIKAFAYLSAGTGTCISTNDSGSYVDVAVGTDDRPTFAAIKVKLIDKTFNGQGTSSLAVTNGGYNYAASESLVVPYVISTLAGNGSAGSADGTGVAAQFNTPHGVALDGAGNIYVGDASNHRIRKIAANGYVSTLAGSTQGYSDGTGTAAKFNYPYALAADSAGNVYVADSGNHRIRKIIPNGCVTTLAGSTVGSADGTGTAAQFNSPCGITLDAAGVLYIGDRSNHRIRKIDANGYVSTLAGSSQGYADGTGTAAQFYNPECMAVDGSGNVYVSDRDNMRIRKIATNGYVSTFAGSSAGNADGTGTSAQFNQPEGIIFDVSGNLLVADRANYRIRKIAPNGYVSTIAGSTVGYADGYGTATQFNAPWGLAMDSYGNLYIGDINNSRIRRLR